MSESRSSQSLIFFLAGLGIGAVAALLLAPQSGEEVRKLINKKAREGKDFLVDKSEEARRQAGDLVEKSRDILDKGRERFASAVEAGKKTYNATLGR